MFYTNKYIILIQQLSMYSQLFGPLKHADQELEKKNGLFASFLELLTLVSIILQNKIVFICKSTKLQYLYNFMKLVTCFKTLAASQAIYRLIYHTTELFNYCGY